MKSDKSLLTRRAKDMLEQVFPRPCRMEGTRLNIRPAHDNMPSAAVTAGYLASSAHTHMRTHACTGAMRCRSRVSLRSSSQMHRPILPWGHAAWALANNCCDGGNSAVGFATERTRVCDGRGEADEERPQPILGRYRLSTPTKGGVRAEAGPIAWGINRQKSFVGLAVLPEPSRGFGAISVGYQAYSTAPLPHTAAASVSDG